MRDSPERRRLDLKGTRTMAMQRWKALQAGHLKPNHKRVEPGTFEFDFDVPVEQGGYAYLVKPDAAENDPEFGVREVRLPSWVVPAKPLRADHEPGAAALIGDVGLARVYKSEEARRLLADADAAEAAYLAEHPPGDEGAPTPPSNLVGRPQVTPQDPNIEAARARSARLKEATTAQRAAKGAGGQTESEKVAEAQRRAKGAEG